MTQTTVVRLSAASKRYEPAGPPALDGIDLDIARGEAVAVMGPSGSGKSTLLNLIAGVDRASAGRVEVGGTELGRLSEAGLARFRRAHVGVVFQFFHLLDELTVRDNVLLPAQLAGTAAASARARAARLIEALGLTDRADAYPARLSGGERQRVAIARAVMNRPDVLLADEPTGAVDAATGAAVVELLTELNRDGQTLILVTHDPGVARRCARRIVELRDGRIVAERPADGVPAVAR